VRDTYQRNGRRLGKVQDRQEMLRRLTELNVKEQVQNVANNTTAQDC
jgi:carbonic anhydrase